MKAFFLLPLLLTSCTVTSKDFNVAIGGKGAAKGASYAVTWDNERSFQDGTMLAGVAIAAAQAAKQTIAEENTTRVLNTNATKQAINASNNATAVELGAQATGLETTKATVLNPNAP